MTSTFAKAAGGLLGALALAACAGGSGHVRPAPPSSAVISMAETDAIFALLMDGDEVTARRHLKPLLKRDPMNSTAQLLKDSITLDPNELLGPQSYVYSVRSGDTVVGLAQRFLGNRLKAYQLLRYNALKAPAELTAGQSLRIPGRAPRPEPSPVRKPDPVAAPVRPTSGAPRTKTIPAKPSIPAANPMAARQARGAGLAALNQGNVNRAVASLRRATALDPGNPVIARDLARAERIAAAVRARK